jgi:PelA/Pel-15E family pectate lyase
MKKLTALLLSAILFCQSTFSQKENLSQQAGQTMLKATKFMMDSVSTHGGFVWYYLPDMSRRWGEMEAYKTMIWVQDGGTVSVGHMLLDAYNVTHDEYYYQAAEKVADAMIWGQSHEGGWNYLIDFAGDNSLKEWYATIGKNGWRLEEFQHYYGNDTYDDDVSSDAARFLLRMYLEKLDPKYKPSLDKAIDFVLKSQYPNGGWPQRYPLMYDFNKAGHPDYTSFYTFNDDVIWQNVLFLIQCYETLGEKRFLEPIKKGMDFYLLSQKKNGAWGQQYNQQMEVAGARTYEPAAYLPRATFWNSLLLLKFYEYTGDKKFLKTIPEAIKWLEKEELPADKTQNGRYTHPLFVDVKTDKPIYVHRRGSNVKHGYYYTDTSDVMLLGHMSGKSNINLQYLKDEYARVSALPVEKAIEGSPIKMSKFSGQGTPQNFYDLKRNEMVFPSPSDSTVKSVINSLDNENRWLVKHVMISHPYIGDGQLTVKTDAYASTFVGDSTDTSPFRDMSDQLYISTPAYIRNMDILIGYIKEIDKKEQNKKTSSSVLWKLNNKTSIGSFSPTIFGNPEVIIAGNDTSIFFNGQSDGIVIPSIPIQGWQQFTIEARFKPDSKGPSAPRFLHFEDSQKNRGTLEARLTSGGDWYLDVFLKNGKTNKGLTLIDSLLLHKSDQWYSVALSYDGKKMYSYVNGRKELEGDFDFPAMTNGETSIGVRLNKVNWFRGEISQICFYPEAMKEKMAP